MKVEIEQDAPHTYGGSIRVRVDGVQIPQVERFKLSGGRGDFTELEVTCRAPEGKQMFMADMIVFEFDDLPTSHAYLLDLQAAVAAKLAALEREAR